MVLSEVKPTTYSNPADSDDGLLHYDDKGRVVRSNASVSRMLGYTDAELRGKSILELHPVEYMLESMRAFREIGDTGFARMNLLFRRKDGGLLYADTVIMIKKLNGRTGIEARLRELLPA